MARNTTGNATTNRSKKTSASKQPAVMQVGVEVPVTEVPSYEVPKKGKSVKVVPVNLEEQIRRRAYELYLERRATAGYGNGDENQDWLIAEREIRSRQGNQEHHTA